MVCCSRGWCDGDAFLWCISLVWKIIIIIDDAFLFMMILKERATAWLKDVEDAFCFSVLAVSPA